MADHLSNCVTLKQLRQYFLVGSGSEAVFNLIEQEIEKFSSILLYTWIDGRNERC